MKKWIFALILILIPALLFAAGLRIDFKVLGDRLQKKPDHNAEALRKMGIDPGQIDFKGKSWWTFNPEDNLFKRAPRWNPMKQISDDAQKTTQELKKELGPSPGEVLASQAQAAAAQTRLYQQRAEQIMQEAQQ
jgi:hypothetical protein